MAVKAATGRRALVTVGEAADTLGVDARTLKSAGKRKEIPLRRIGTRYFLPAAWLSSVTEWPPENGEVA